MAVNVPPTDPQDDPPPTDWSVKGPQLERQLAESNKHLDAARKEAASLRVGQRGPLHAFGEKLAQKLGVAVQPDQAIDYEDLLSRADASGQAAKVESLSKELRAAKLDLHLERAFNALGVRPMLARGFMHESGAMKKLSALDPDSETFADDVAYHVSEAIESEPALKGGRASFPRSPTARMTPPPHSQQLGREDLALMTPDEVNAARERGLLDQLLGRR